MSRLRTSGTITFPFETIRFTAEPSATSVFKAGRVSMTLPAATVAELPCVIVPRVSFMVAKTPAASVSVRPVSDGTFTVLAPAET